MRKGKLHSISMNDTSYDEFINKLSLVELRLISSSSKLDSKSLERMITSKASNVTRMISVNYKLKSVGENYFESTAQLGLAFRSQKTKLTPVKVECTFSAHFHVKTPFTKKLAQRFTDSELRLVVWPYFRQFVQDTTARMSIPPVLIPFSVEGPQT
jgi:preprotein translocase subunit SecB